MFLLLSFQFRFQAAIARSIRPPIHLLQGRGQASIFRRAIARSQKQKPPALSAANVHIRTKKENE